MSDRLFQLNNPNADIMVVPQQEGGSEEDGYFGSIGDATMQHVYSLDGYGRQMWEELYVAPSGAMFRAVPSSSWHDNDPFNLKGQDLDLWLAEYCRTHYGDKEIPEKDLVALREAIEEEQTRRDESEDVYDQDDVTRIPYAEWEKFPQMWDQWEMPRTPRDMMIYMGNTRDQFFDARPEGHPDMPVIMEYIGRLNCDWDRFESDEEAAQYCDYLVDELATVAAVGGAKPYTTKYLTMLVLKIKSNEGDPEEHAEWALGEIDRCWAIEYKNAVAKKMTKDHVYHLMLHKQREWNKALKAGVSGLFAQVKALGQALFEDFKDDMRGHHWALYRRMKRKFAPNVIIRGVNVNHGRLCELEELCNGDHNLATKIWFNRPYDSVAHVFNQGYVTRKTFADNPDMEALLERLEGFAELAKKEQNVQAFQPIVKALIQGQKVGSLKVGNRGIIQLSHKEWSLVWAYYRMLREDAQSCIQKEQREAREREVQLMKEVPMTMSVADELDMLQAEEMYG